MSEDWQVKEVRKDGNDTWIKLGPQTTHSADDSRGVVHIFNTIVLSMSFMSLFEVTGFGWWAFWAVISLAISIVLYIPSLVMSLIILGFFIFT